MDKTYPKRSLTQNDSLHLFCRELSEKLNDGGISMKMLMDVFDLDWTEHSVKQVFQKIGEQKFGKKKTSEFTTVEMTQAWEEVNRATSLKGVSVLWPSQDSLREYN